MVERGDVVGIHSYSLYIKECGWTQLCLYPSLMAA